MEGLKVKCQTCGQVLYETTKNYNCHKPLTGNMLKLLPLYKDWPTYDGALATESTSRFLMFCSACAGYISITGRLTFVDFPDKRVTEVSRERSMILCNEDPVDIIEKLEKGATISSKKEFVDNLILPNAEDSALSDELQKMTPDLMTPEDLMKKIEKGATISRKKRRNNHDKIKDS